jgi:TolB protein
MWRDDGAEIYEYDLSQQCCLRKLTGTGRTISMNPSVSPDGRSIAFMSDRIGRPAVYVMSADGSNATMLSPFQQGQRSDYSSPSWSPTGSRVAFHGVWNASMRGSYQIMIADATRPGAQIEQITGRGNNEDPSWAPDGRHLVFTAAGDGPAGLYIIDVETKTRRLLASGGNLRMAEWSPVLLRASELVAQ